MDLLEKADILQTMLPYDISVDVQKSYQAGSGDWVMEGYASTDDPDISDEVITREALSAAHQDLIERSTVLYNHKSDQPVGRVLEAKMDEIGLWVKVLISKTCPEIWQRVVERVLNKFSIRARVLQSSKKFDESVGRVLTYISQIKILELSLCALPVNAKAEALRFYVAKAMRSHEMSRDILDSLYDQAVKAGVIPNDPDQVESELRKSVTEPAVVKETQKSTTPPAEPAVVEVPAEVAKADSEETQISDVHRLVGEKRFEDALALLTKLESADVADETKAKIKAAREAYEAATKPAEVEKAAEDKPVETAKADTVEPGGDASDLQATDDSVQKACPHYQTESCPVKGDVPTGSVPPEAQNCSFSNQFACPYLGVEKSAESLAEEKKTASRTSYKNLLRQLIGEAFDEKLKTMAQDTQKSILDLQTKLQESVDGLRNEVQKAQETVDSVVKPVEERVKSLESASPTRKGVGEEVQKSVGPKKDFWANVVPDGIFRP